MNRFEYSRPATVADAVAAASQPGTAYLAAGTNLLDLMKGGIARPERLVDVGRLGLDGIEVLQDGSVRIGAFVRNATLAYHPDFARRFPSVAEGAVVRRIAPAAQCRDHCRQRYAAHPLRILLRHRQRLQQAGSPGQDAMRVAGENRLHAILGWSEHCIATHPSDMCVPLVALDAVVEIQGAHGVRDVPLEAFHTLPGDTPAIETVLMPGELIVAVRVPGTSAAFAGHSRYLKVRERTSYAFAVVSAAASVRVEEGVIAEARVALGGVALKPWRSRAAEAVLVGAAPKRRGVSPGRRCGAAGCKAVRRQRLQDRTRPPHHRAGAHARHRGHAGADARAAGLALCFRSRDPCLISVSCRIPPISAKARAPGSR